ncbi:DMT family transporter [Lacrimispora aerotolerans]|uniref:DMT family transporter n=1 Tax=Lacrimispora aerotolerans TaxID=36832 RepID=UPI00047A9260|nr:EamA family transporter [Lacrimispora aerotolerans]
MTELEMTAVPNLKKGCILTLFGGILWGLSGTCGQYLMQSKGLTSDWLIPIRLLLAGIILLTICFIKDGKKVFQIFKTPRDGLDVLIFGMFGMSMCQYTYFTAISQSNAGTATVLQYIGPVLIVIYVSLKTGKRPDKIEVLAVLLAILGTVLLATHGKLNSLAISHKALFWGLCSAVALAVYTVQPGAILTKYGSMIVTGWGMLIGGVLLCLFFRPWTMAVTVDAGVIGGLTYIILFGTIVAFVAYLEGVKWVGPKRGSLFASVEPVSATLFSALLLKVGFGLMDLLGFACIISTIFLLTLGKRR